MMFLSICNAFLQKYELYMPGYEINHHMQNKYFNKVK